MARRSREIGWGPEDILTWKIEQALSCTCVPTTTLFPVSDSRLKCNIKPTGLMIAGFKEYKWDWTEEAKALGVHHHKTRGVMADEVILTKPQAVVFDEQIGYYRVDYNALKS